MKREKTEGRERSRESKNKSGEGRGMNEIVNKIEMEIAGRERREIFIEV